MSHNAQLNEINGESFSLDPYQHPESEVQSTCSVTTPSKTYKKKKERDRQSSIQSIRNKVVQQQLNQSNSNTSIMKQVMRKDIELEQLRDHNVRLQDKVNDLEFLLNKAAEEVRKKNEDYSGQEVEIAQLKLELHQFEMGKNMELSHCPQFLEVWNRGIYIEEENQELRIKLEELEYDLQSKSESIQQAHDVIEQLQQELQRQDDELKLKTKKLRKLRAKYKENKLKLKSTADIDLELGALKRENENIKEDMKQMLKDKIEQERVLRKKQPEDLSQMSHQLKQQEAINRQLEAKIKTFEEQLLKTAQSREQDFEYSTFNRELNHVEQELRICHEQIKQQEQCKHQYVQEIQEIENQNRILQQSLEEQRNQNKLLSKALSENLITSAVHVAGSQCLKHDLTYSRSNCSQPKNIPDLNLRNSQEDQDLFDDRSKIHSSRLQTQRQGGGIKRSQLHVTSNNRSQLDLSQTTEQSDPLKEWVQGLPLQLLQEELLKSLDREQFSKVKIQEWLQTIKIKDSEQMIKSLMETQEETHLYVSQIHEQLWIEQNRSIVLKEMLQDACNQFLTLKGLQKQSKQQDVPCSEVVTSNPFRFDDFNLIIEQVNRIPLCVNQWKQSNVFQWKTQNEKHKSESERQIQESKLQLLEKQTSILQQVEAQLEQKNQEIIRLQNVFQQEKQAIYKEWEKEQQSNSKSASMTIEQLKLENQALRKNLERHKENSNTFDKTSRQLENEFDRTPLSNKNSLTQRVQTELLSSYQSSVNYKGDVQDMITHYKKKAKSSYEKKVQELETLLRYLSESANGYDFERNRFRFQPNKMNSQNQILKQTLEKMQQKNSTVIKFVKDIQYTIDGLYQELNETKLSLISFLNQAVVHVISQDPHGTEEIIKQNPEVQNCLNWLLEIVKPESVIQDVKLLSSNCSQLWNYLIIKSHPFNYDSSPQRQNYSEISCFKQTYLSSPSLINDSMQQHNPLTNDCAVPELQYILDVQMKVVYNLLQALTTLCANDKKESQSSLHQVNSEAPLMGFSLITSIRPSLDISNQVIKSLMPRFYSVPKEESQQKLDSFVQNAVKYLQELNKTLNDLPLNFFNSLTLQHNSVTLQIQEFSNQIQKIFDSHSLCGGNEAMIVQEFISQLKGDLNNDSLAMFMTFIQYICYHRSNPELIKDLHSTFIVYLHRKEVQSSAKKPELQKTKRNYSENKSQLILQSTMKQSHEKVNQHQLFEEIASFFAQIISLV